MKDQYGQEVPADLVVLHFGFEPGESVIRGDRLEPEEVDIISKANWYEVEDVPLILASYEAIDGLSELNPLDYGIDLQAPEIKINRIADPLKRYSWEDGFYHA
jgi:hypothetical protein